jgi:hypothetical protein
MIYTIFWRQDYNTDPRAKRNMLGDLKKDTENMLRLYYRDLMVNNI